MLSRPNIVVSTLATSKAASTTPEHHCENTKQSPDHWPFLGTGTRWPRIEVDGTDALLVMPHKR